MPVVLQKAKELLLRFAKKSIDIFSTYNSSVIIRRKKNLSNIDSRYVCQFTIELLTRQAGGFRGTADRLSEVLGADSKINYSASSICEARKKFPAELFLELNKALIEETPSQNNFWQGRRLFAIDGSKIVLPKGLEKYGFKPERKQSHYPMGRLSCLYEVGTQLIHDISLNSHCDERKAAISHFSTLSTDDVVIYDRGYFSFNLLAVHRQNKNDFVMRFSEKTGVRELEDFIQKNIDKKSSQSTVKIAPVGANTKRKLAKDFPSEKQEFLVRLIKYTYDTKPYYLITSLVNKNDFPRKLFPDLYHSRWGVEETYKQLKVYLLRKEFHSACLRTVCQEVYASALVANMSRVLTLSIEEEKMDSKKKSSLCGIEQDFTVASQQVIRLFSNDNVRDFTI